MNLTTSQMKRDTQKITTTTTAAKKKKIKNEKIQHKSNDNIQYRS